MSCKKPKTLQAKGTRNSEPKESSTSVKHHVINITHRHLPFSRERSQSEFSSSLTNSTLRLGRGMWLASVPRTLQDDESSMASPDVLKRLMLTLLDARD